MKASVLMALEALASGTPVVTSNALVFEEVLEDAVYMVDNAREMAGAIIALLIQQPLRETMINQGWRWRATTPGAKPPRKPSPFTKASCATDER